MSDARKAVMRMLVKEALEGIDLSAPREPGLTPAEKKSHSFEAKLLLENKCLAYVVSRICRKASENIVRSTKNDEEIAWNRGALFALECLDKELRTLAAMKVPDLP